MELLSLTSKGLYCALGDFYIDPWQVVETAVITHAHGDHAKWGMQKYITVTDNQYILKKEFPILRLSHTPMVKNLRWVMSK